MRRNLCILVLVIALNSRASWSLLEEEELERHRGLESFVELKGGEFFMGINDREGVNDEYPHRKALVNPFR